MTASSRPDHLLTLDEWDSLPEDTFSHSELVEGVVSMAPQPLFFHQRAMYRLAYLLDEQLPDALTANADVEVIVDPNFPPTVRVPDVVVVPTEVGERNPSRCDASDVLLTVEIISPGSKRMDRVAKLFEYADAGIPNYWLLDPNEPATLTAYTLVDGEYELVAEGSGVLSLSEPAPVTIDVGALVRRR